MKNNLLLLGRLFTFSILIITLSVSLLLSHTSTEILAQQQQLQDNNATESEPKFFVIQNAQSGIISEINSTAYTLEQNNVSDTTILFSDRPDRIVTTMSTTDFIGNWTTGSDSFSLDPPNAVLIYDDIQTMDLDVSILELYDPIYNSTNNSLIYTITTTNNTALELIEKIGQAVLVIDSPPCNPTDDSTNRLSLNDCGY